MKYLLLVCTLIFTGFRAHSENKVKLRIVQTTDIHGSVLGWDFMESRPLRTSFTGLYSYLTAFSEEERNRTVVLDNGDLLQGQVSVSFYNQHPELGQHIVSKAMNLLKVDAATVGNEDLEAGKSVLEKVRQELNFPWLGANVIDKSTQKPFLEPYTILYKNGVKVAVLGLSNPGIPRWMSHKIWNDLSFEDMVSCARRWVDTIMLKENPDILVGLFHTGFRDTEIYSEEDIDRASTSCEMIAREVPGFDVIFFGHDHSPMRRSIYNVDLKPVVLINPGVELLGVCEIEIDTVTKKKMLTSSLVDFTHLPRSEDFLDHFQKEIEEVRNYVDAPVYFQRSKVESKDALFGPASFTDFVNRMQLSITGADISFASAPRPDIDLDSGEVCVRHLFNLYSLENTLAMVEMKGSEIKQYIEIFAEQWFHTIKDTNDALLRLRSNARGRYQLVTPMRNLDAAGGICYEVDVTQPVGDRVTIHSMDDSAKTPFDMQQVYKVAMNSFRVNGGDDFLSQVRMKHLDFRERVIWESKDCLQVIFEAWLRDRGLLTPEVKGNWKVVPEHLVEPILRREKEMLFPSQTVRLRIIEMADLHGNFFEWDHIRDRPSGGGYPAIYSFVENERRNQQQEVILLNGGDLLQGQLGAYFYNYLDDRKSYRPAVLMNKLKVDASVLGNHDVEQGRFVLERYAQELRSPLLAANFIDMTTREPYFQPYVCINKGGVKIAILGLTTPIMTKCAYPMPMENLRTMDMFDAAQYWVKRIHEEEKPDILLGLIHGSVNSSELQREDCEIRNSAEYIGRNIPGFDAMLLGHEHKLQMLRIENIVGDSVWLIEPGYGGRCLGILDFDIQLKMDKSEVVGSHAQLVDISKWPISDEITRYLSPEADLVAQMMKDTVVMLMDTMRNVDAFFGPSFFVDLIHKVQMDVTQADVSFASPLSSNVTLYPGPLFFSDLFRLYRFENVMCVVQMTGEEIRNYLEFSYDQWIQTITQPEQQLLRVETTSSFGGFLNRNFVIPQYNFDSGDGIVYTVDVTKPYGQRVKIKSFKDGSPFFEGHWYRVVTNYHRAMGNGGHMVLGAKIPTERLPSRVATIDTKMIREHIRLWLKNEKELRKFTTTEWSFEAEFIEPVLAREREMLEQ